MPVHKDKKTNKWYFRVYFDDINGHKREKKKTGFNSKREALEQEERFKTKIYALKNEANTNMTFQNLYDIYIKDKYQKLKPKSYMTLESIFINHILPFFKDYKINKITNKDYIEWKSYILKKGFSYKYNTSIHICMVNILNYAINFYGLEKNIASKVGNFANNNYVPKVDFWTVEEFKKFINVIDDFTYKTLFTLLFNTGVRIGEALALNWNDINEGFLNIDKTLSRSKNDNYIINSPKTSSSVRKIELDKTTLNYLEELKKQQAKVICFSDKWFMFGGIKPLSRTTVATRKNNYCKIANVKRIRIHDFRHSNASMLISNGVPFNIISGRLGHKDVSITLEVYSHFIRKDEKKAINVINKIYE